jgi:hypothetical protein
MGGNKFSQFSFLPAFLLFLFGRSPALRSCCAFHRDVTTEGQRVPHTHGACARIVTRSVHSKYFFLNMFTRRVAEKMKLTHPQLEPSVKGQAGRNLNAGNQANVPLQPWFLLNIKKKTPWSESTSELYRPSDRRLSAK